MAEGPNKEGVGEMYLARVLLDTSGMLPLEVPRSLMGGGAVGKTLGKAADKAHLPSAASFRLGSTRSRGPSSEHSHRLEMDHSHGKNKVVLRVTTHSVQLLSLNHPGHAARCPRAPCAARSWQQDSKAAAATRTTSAYPRAAPRSSTTPTPLSAKAFDDD